MRSIRRSSIAYLLLLLGMALIGLGVLVDQVAGGAIRAREEAETRRIEQTYELRKHEATAKFDADLLREAKTHFRELGVRIWGLRDPNRDGRPEPPPPPEGRQANQPLFIRVRPPEEVVNEYKLRATALTAGTLATREWGPMLMLGVATEGFHPAQRPFGPFTPAVLPAWLGYDTPRAVARFGESLQHAYEEVVHPGYFQFNLVLLHPPGTPGPAKSVIVIRSAQFDQDLPFDLDGLERNTNFEHAYSDLDLPGKGHFRQLTALSPQRIVIGLGAPIVPQPAPTGPMGGAGRPPAGPGGPPGAPGRRNLPESGFAVRAYVQVARPYTALNDLLAEDQRDRDAELARVQDETRTALARLQTRLGAIGVISFVALGVGGWLVVGRGLRPVGRLSEAVSRVSEKDFNLPYDPAELPVELVPIHARLTQTLDLLRRAFAREKQAVADISHELRTPIASLLATIDVSLRKPRSPDQYRATLEDCRVIARQLGQLVERIMTLASLDAGTARTAVARADAADIAAGCAAVIRPLAESHGVTLAPHIDGPLELDTDPDKLREVLMNLLHNAVEYNRPGGTIDLSGRVEDGKVVLEVRDAGIGMTAEVREKIFERFYRADASRQATGVHAGLGLAIVKEYVERLNGTITVESEPGVGTTFRVAFPAAPEPPAGPPSVKVRTPLETPLPARS